MKSPRFHRFAAFVLVFVIFITAACSAPPLVATEPVFPSAQVPATGGGMSVTVADQELTGDTVVIPEVVSEGPGWIAIHVQQDGSVGPVIAFAPVNDGVNKDVTVQVDPAKVTPVLYAMLHVDAGTVGAYEFPGPDVPAKQAGVDLSPPFALNAGMTHEGVDSTVSSIKVSDQEIKNGKVVVEEVVTDVNAWVDIHIQGPDGNYGRHIGFTAVEPGTHKNVEVVIDPQAATPVLYAMLHVDAGEPGTYESPNGPDVAVRVDGVMVAPTFRVLGAEAAAVSTDEETPTGAAATVEPTSATAATTPTAEATVAASATVVAQATTEPETQRPNIRVVDQPIIDSKIVFPEVFSIGPAWLVIHRQNGDGTMGSMVGFAPIQDGVNREVAVELDTTRTSGIMFAMLHHDLGTVGTLEFPGADGPVEVDGQVLAPSFAITARASNDVTVNLSQIEGSVNHLVEGNGRSLYIFLNDEPGKSNCTSTCLNEWRPLLATGRIIAGANVPQDRLGVILLPDGTRQVTYLGSPLYTYIHDSNNGDTKGQGIDGLWFIITP